MKRAIAALLIAVAMPVMAAGTDVCGFINSDTGRAFCFGKKYHDAGYCSIIQNDTQRVTCEAQAIRDPNRCNFINDDDARNMCKSQAST